MTRFRTPIRAQAVAQRWASFPFVDSTTIPAEITVARRIEKKATTAMKREGSLRLTLAEREAAKAIAQSWIALPGEWTAVSSQLLRDLRIAAGEAV